MKVLVSYILLFFYVLTCTGGSVYMHQCNGGSIHITKEDAADMHKSCPMCAEQHKNNKVDANTCPMDEDRSCCKDIKIDLKKSNDDAEHAQHAPVFLGLSPATITLFWIISFQISSESNLNPPTIEAPHLLASTNPTYLILCNFRIWSTSFYFFWIKGCIYTTSMR